MRYLALACDYDGTLASVGRVNEETLAALRRLLASGRKLILVTGRLLDDLLRVFPHLNLFERVVAENGALIYRPASREKKVQGDPPPAAFIKALQDRGIMPLSVGEVIVATYHPHETAVLNVIRDLGLEMQVIFNKGSVMVLPAGINKATGLRVALCEMGLSPHNLVAVGDAENDHAFLNLCECSVAVADALPVVKDHVDFVTAGENGAGVIELIDEIVTEDLQRREERLTRHHILLGTRKSGEKVRIGPYGVNLLLAGSSGSGKSTLATAVLERLGERGYQFCVIDPEGDYESFEEAVALGSNQRAPNPEEVLRLLKDPEENVIVNLVGLPIGDRPSFFLALMARLQELRAQIGRPHWLVVDEAHHVLPASWEPASLALPKEFDRTLFITVEPKSVAPAALSSVDTVIAIGESPEKTLAEFGEALGQRLSSIGPVSLEDDEALMWSRRTASPPFVLRMVRGRSERRRHRRKYAEGDVGLDKSFYFQGPEGKLNLQAQNLLMFMQIAEGVDEDTWNHHLRRGDYSRWFREVIKDEALAAEAARIEHLDVSAAESRALMKAAIEQNYTAPA